MLLKARVSSYLSKLKGRLYIVLLGTKFGKKKLKAIMWHRQKSQWESSPWDQESKGWKADTGFLGSPILDFPFGQDYI